jgi:hypothetical protein
MKKIIIFFYALCSLTVAFATGQDGDIIYIDGERWKLLGKPATSDSILGSNLLAILPEERSWDTGNWEGYTGWWSIKNNKLYLDSITVKFYNKETQQHRQQSIGEADMRRVFSNYYQNNTIVATWVKKIRAAKGNLVYYEHIGYERNLEYEQIFTIDNGDVTNRQSFHNKIIKGFSLADPRNRGKWKDILPLNVNAYPELNGEKKLVISVKDIRVDSLGNLIDCNVAVMARTNDDEQKRKNIEGLASEVKTTLKNIHPWKTLFIYGEYIAADKNGFTFPYDLTFGRKDAISKQPVSNDTLSMPVIRYGVATIKGHLYDFRKEILKNIILRRSLSVYDTLQATISDDGDFEFRFPVTHTRPVIIGYDGGYFMMCYVSPGDTTHVRLDINVIQKPALKRDENYVNVEEGPLSQLANEYNHTQYSKSYADMRKKALGRYYNHPDLIGSNPKELFPKVITTGTRDRSKMSPALQELMRLNDQLTLLVVYQSELTNNPSYINKRGVAARTLYNKRRKKWAADIEDIKNEAFLDMLTSPKLLLCPAFMDFVHYFKNVPMDYPKYVDDELKTYSLKQQLEKEFSKIDSIQFQQSISTLSEPYRLWIQEYRRKLSKLITENTNNSNFRICTLPKVPESCDYMLFEKICSQYKGCPIFLYIWNPASIKSMSFVHNTIIPLQKEFSDYDIAWINLGVSDNEISWQQQLSQLEGYHYAISGYQPTGIAYGVMNKNSPSTFIHAILDEKGNVVYKRNEQNDLQSLREELKKYVTKKK